MLAYAEYGAPTGPPIVFFHGSPGSRLGGRLLDRAGKTLGTRIFAVDRPGQGCSSSQPTLTILNWVEDLLELVNQIGLDRFGVIGFSGGGPYAAACAHEIPHRLFGVAMVSSIAPPNSSAEGTHPSNQLKRWLLRSIPWLIEIPLRLSTWAAKRDSKRFVSVMTADSSAADQALLSQPEVAKIVRDEFVEAVRPGISGIAREARLYDQPWGFDLEGIDYPIHIHQGKRDVNVPPSMGCYLQKSIPRSHATFYPDEGHVSTLANHTEEIISGLLRS